MFIEVIWNRLLCRNLCHTVSSSTRFVQKLLSCNLAELFTESERDNLMGRVSVKKSTVPLETSVMFPPPGESYAASDVVHGMLQGKMLLCICQVFFIGPQLQFLMSL